MSTETRRFRTGDVVKVRNNFSAGTSTWMVVGDDTNRTPVRDPEPAYKLARGCERRKFRYAYESDLTLAWPDGAPTPIAERETPDVNRR